MLIIVWATAAPAAPITYYVWEGGPSSNDPPGAGLWSTNMNLAGSAGLYYYNTTAPSPIMMTNRYFYIGCKQTATNRCMPFDPSRVSTRAWSTFDTNNWGRATNGDFWVHAYGTTPTNDNANTVEGIIVTDPPVGLYTVEVSARAVPYPPVRYGLVMSGALGPPAAVVLYDFYLRAENGLVLACWQTASETATIGFDVFREDAGAWVKVNSAMIPATGWPQGGIGVSYCVDDPAARADGTFRYKLVEYETTGRVLEYGPFERSVWTPRVSSVLTTPAGVVVQWPSRTPEVYDALKAADLRAECQPMAQGLPATPPVNAWTDRTDAAGAAFYRIEAR